MMIDKYERYIAELKRENEWLKQNKQDLSQLPLNTATKNRSVESPNKFTRSSKHFREL